MNEPGLILIGEDETEMTRAQKILERLRRLDCPECGMKFAQNEKLTHCSKCGKKLKEGINNVNMNVHLVGQT